METEKQILEKVVIDNKNSNYKMYDIFDSHLKQNQDYQI